MQRRAPSACAGTDSGKDDAMLEATRRNFLKGVTFAATATAAACGFAARSAAGAATEPTTQPHQPMLTRPIPSAGERIPVIGMGTWQTLDPDRLDDASLQPLQDVLKLFFDAEGRVVDSSPMYGKAEEVTGLLADLLKINPDLFLATKVWTRGQDAGIKQMESSLQKLRRQ